MESQKPSKNPAFWAALSMIIVTIALATANYSGLLQLHVLVGPFFIHHWMSWSGSLFIAIATPAYSYLKRRSPEKRELLSKVHMFGNLGAFLLISIHFSQQISRPAEFFPDLGTGLALFIAVSILVTTGVLQKFQIVKELARYYRLIHIGATMTFYIIIVIHILHGLGII
jgi:hypothetical protein